MKSLKLNAALNFIKCFMNIIFPIISFPYASRILLPEGIGKVNFINSVVEYFLIIAGLGIGTYATREAAKIRDNHEELSKFSREILSINLLSTLVAYILFVISLFFVPKFHDYKVLLIVCSTKILFSTIGIEWLYRAVEDFGYITIRHVAFQIISLVLMFTLVKTEDDYLIYAGIGVFSNVGANVFNFTYSRKYINLFQKSKFEIKKHIKPIFTFFGVTCSSKINSLLDTVMLGFLAGDVSVGFYSAATKLEKMVRELITSVISVFMPRTSYLLEKGELEEYQAIVNRVFNITFFFSVPAAVGLFALAEPLTLVFCGEKYLPAVTTMRLLSFAVIILSFNSYLMNLILIPNKLEKFILYSQISGLLANIALNYFLITKWGVFGAGLATLIVEIILPVVNLIPSLKLIKDKSNLINMLKTFIASGVMYAVIYFAFNNFQNAWLHILLAMGTGAITYGIFVLILKHSSAQFLVSFIKTKLKK